MQYRVKKHLMKSAYRLSPIWERNLMRCLIHYPVFFSTSSSPAIISCVYLFCLSLQLCLEGKCIFIFLINKQDCNVSQALMSLISDVYLTHTDISCSRHHNCSLSKPFLNKCKEICLQLPNAATSSEIHGCFWSSVEEWRLLNGSVLSAQNCPVLKELLQVLQNWTQVWKLRTYCGPKTTQNFMFVAHKVVNCVSIWNAKTWSYSWDILER